ncbi:mCG1030136, partial [Mus musculus]
TPRGCLKSARMCTCVCVHVYTWVCVPTHLSPTLHFLTVPCLLMVLTLHLLGPIVSHAWLCLYSPHLLSLLLTPSPLSFALVLFLTHKNYAYCQAVVVHAFNPSAQEAEVGRSM